MTSSFDCLKYSCSIVVYKYLPISVFVTMMLLHFWWPTAFAVQRCFLTCGRWSVSLCSPGLLQMTNRLGRGGGSEENSLIWIRKGNEMRLRKCRQLLLFSALSRSSHKAATKHNMLLTNFAHSSRLPTSSKPKSMCISLYKCMDEALSLMVCVIATLYLNNK